jgi:large subunit ribosomal protein L5
MSLNLSSIQYKDLGIASVNAELGSTVNIFDLPKIDKISINIGVGKYENKDKALIAEYLEKIVCQKPKLVKSTKSISNFKLRAGDINGISVTLRGKKAFDFLLLLVYIALPRIRDFKGLKTTAFDANHAAYSLGIPSASIFPHIGFDAGINFGMQCNIVFKTKSESNMKLLQAMNLPFNKDGSLEVKAPKRKPTKKFSKK